MTDTEKTPPTEEGEANSSRRDVLATAAKWSAAGALAFAAVGVARLPKPGVMPGQSPDVKIGPPGEYPQGGEAIRVSGQNFFLVHDGEGYAAISAVCTHLGCIVSASAEGFVCPCHGSAFGPDGHVTHGPAGSPLAWYHLTRAPDGRIIVHTGRTVRAGTRYPLA